MGETVALTASFEVTVERLIAWQERKSPSGLSRRSPLRGRDPNEVFAYCYYDGFFFDPNPNGRPTRLKLIVPPEGGEILHDGSGLKKHIPIVAP